MALDGVVVVGSINADQVVTVARHPLPGETLIGGSISVLPGGKGANQAVAAALLGARVSMVGATGRDAHALTAIGTGWTAFEGRSAADLRLAIETGATTAGGAFHGTTGQLGVFGQQLRKRAVDARDEVRGRVRRDGTGRDHGYPGGRARPPRYDPGPR